MIKWCEASIHIANNRPYLLMKDVSLPPLSHAYSLVGDFSLWDERVDPSSLNVQFALKSRVPTLVGKAVP